MPYKTRITLVCDHCGIEFKCIPNSRRCERKCCSRRCARNAVVPPIEERFWSRVERRGEDDCWLWTGAVSSKGYGKFAKDAKSCLAHRVSYQLSGYSIPDGMMVLHRCDTPLCVNPRHLFLGTNDDNMLDALKKGRIPAKPAKAWRSYFSKRPETINV